MDCALRQIDGVQWDLLVYRGAYGLTLLSDMTDGTEEVHHDFPADARADLRTLLGQSYCSVWSRDFRTHDAADSGEGTSLPILDQYRAGGFPSTDEVMLCDL